MTDNHNNSWFSSVTLESMSYELRNIKEFAYRTFDSIDRNGNGYLEYSELEDALTRPGMSSKEKNFIAFLLANHDHIADTVDEGAQSCPDAISRADLEAYFKLVIDLLSPNQQMS